MNAVTKSEDEVKQAIAALIEAGTTFDVETLERIYHDDLEVVSIDQDSNVSVADKPTFKGLFETKRAAGAGPLNTWAEFNRVSVSGDAAHVLITRKVNLVDEDQRLVLSIDMHKRDGQWQVVREVIFARPDTD